jgi:hypothetical protein
MTTWVDHLAVDAPDLVAAWRGIGDGRFLQVRREVRRRAGPGSAATVVPQLAALATALSQIVDGMSDADLRADGGESGWNVAEAIGHDCTARAGLCLAASKAAAGRWPADAPTVVPGVPGSAETGRAALIDDIRRSQRIVERAARVVSGHEDESCPLVHPLVGRLRCGEWLLFAGVHDLMHIEQLHQIIDRHQEGSSAR